MTRSISAALQTAINERNINTTFLLIDIDFSTPVYYTTLSKTISWSGNSYTPSAGVLDLTAPNESLDYRVGTIFLTMTGANQSNISLALSEEYTDKEVIIRRAVLDANADIIADPVIIYKGHLNSYSIEETPLEGRSMVKWEVASHWADFDRVRGRLTNIKSQQSHYAADKGFEFAAQTISEVNWGNQG